MNRKKLLRDLNSWCSDNNMSSRFAKSEGKGSHGTVYITDADGNVRKTLVKDGKLTRTYKNVILGQLGLEKDII